LPLIFLVKSRNLLSHKSAVNNKTLAFAQLFRTLGFKVLVSGFEENILSKPFKISSFEGFLYLPLLSFSTLSLPNFLSIPFVKILNSIQLILKLRRLSLISSSTPHYLMFDSFQASFLLLKLYSIFHPVHFIFNIEEWQPVKSSSMLSRLIALGSFFSSIFIADSVVCISSFLSRKIHYFRPSLPISIIPALSTMGYDSHTYSQALQSSSYFPISYVADVRYFDQLTLVINSFDLFSRYLSSQFLASRSPSLNLILSGDCDELHKISKSLNSHPNIHLYSNLNDHEYQNLLCSSSLLLCPLDSSVSNQARFPQKLAEYSALSGLILTSPVGDIPTYFTHMQNCLFVEKFDAPSLAQSLYKAYSLNYHDSYFLRCNARSTFLQFFSIHSNLKHLVRYQS
jgi:glycosyltransferase involved in cell wall biosynthesis